jgi:hypothetical protein
MSPRSHARDHGIKFDHGLLALGPGGRSIDLVVFVR